MKVTDKDIQVLEDALGQHEDLVAKGSECPIIEKQGEEIERLLKKMKRAKAI